MHGYDVRRTLLSRGATSWANVAPGSIYNALRTLVREGFLENLGTDRQGARPERTCFRLTESGEGEYSRLLRETLTQARLPNHPLLAGLAFLPDVPPAELGRRCAAAPRPCASRPPTTAPWPTTSGAPTRTASQPTSPRATSWWPLSRRPRPGGRRPWPPGSPPTMTSRVRVADLATRTVRARTPSATPVDSAEPTVDCEYSTLNSHARPSWGRPAESAARKVGSRRTGVFVGVPARPAPGGALSRCESRRSGAVVRGAGAQPRRLLSGRACQP